eukprot:1321580-Prymnesium_polylepis.1
MAVSSPEEPVEPGETGRTRCSSQTRSARDLRARAGLLQAGCTRGDGVRVPDAAGAGPQRDARADADAYVARRRAEELLGAAIKSPPTVVRAAEKKRRAARTA